MPFCRGKFVGKKILRSTIYTKVSQRNFVFNIKSHFGSSGYKLHLLEQGPSHTVELTKEEALRYYRQMNIIRKLETESTKLFMNRMIRGFCHLYTGEEAVAVGMNSVMRPQDTVITSYRCHGWAALKCESIESVIAELIGNVSGVSRGKGGSVHMYGPNFYGGNGIVGAQIPLGVGIALKHKYSGTDALSIAICGDGAANQGQVFESYNFAKLHMLPVIFVIENNYYSMGTACSKGSANPEFFRQCSYIPGIRTNGNDILAVIETTKFAMNHILEGKGPIMIEMMTYRYFGHSMSDPDTVYRTRDEIKGVREQKDPLKHLRMLMLDSKLATQEEIKAIQKDAQEQVHKAVETAVKSQPTPIEELTADCYATYSDPIRTTKMLSFTSHKHIAKYNRDKK